MKEDFLLLSHFLSVGDVAMMKLKELASECNISVAGVRYYLNKEGLLDTLPREGKAILVPEDIAKQVIDYYSASIAKEKEVLEVSSKEQANKIEELTNRIKELEATNAALLSTNTEQAKTISMLTESNQQLIATNETISKALDSTALVNKSEAAVKIAKLTTSNEDEAPIEVEKVEETKKDSWLQRKIKNFLNI